MTTLTVADVLTQAAAVIRRNGWHRGYFFRQPGGNSPENCAVCAMGAINVVVFGKPVASDVPQTWEQTQLGHNSYVAVEQFLNTDKGLGGWNDEAERTVDEVLAALEGAAQAERNRAATPA